VLAPPTDPRVGEKMTFPARRGSIVNGIELWATLAAVAMAITAFVTLSMELYVVSGTLFTLTAVAIYIKETRG